MPTFTSPDFADFHFGADTLTIVSMQLLKEGIASSTRLLDVTYVCAAMGFFGS